MIEEWDHSMIAPSVGASVYSYWQLFFFKNMFRDQTPANDPDFAAMIYHNRISTHFFSRMFKQLTDDPTIHKFNRLCNNGYPDYTGETPCAYNVARSFIETKRHLTQNFRPQPSSWFWGDLMTLEFVSMPWSNTFLKPFFHRSVRSGGNHNTVNVAEYLFSDVVKEMQFKGRNAPNYKQIVQLN